MSSLASRHTVQLDERGRVSFPAQYRTRIGEELYISPDSGYRGFLVVRSEEGFNQQIEFLKQEGIKNGDTSEEIEDTVRDFAMMTAQVTADKNGRLTLPKELKEYAGLDLGDKAEPKEEKGRAIVVGIGDHAEIWAEKTMIAYEERRRKEKLLKRKKADADHAAKMKKVDEDEL